MFFKTFTIYFQSYAKIIKYVLLYLVGIKMARHQCLAR